MIFPNVIPNLSNQPNLDECNFIVIKSERLIIIVGFCLSFVMTSRSKISRVVRSRACSWMSASNNRYIATLYSKNLTNRERRTAREVNAHADANGKRQTNIARCFNKRYHATRCFFYHRREKQALLDLVAMCMHVCVCKCCCLVSRFNLPWHKPRTWNCDTTHGVTTWKTSIRLLWRRMCRTCGGDVGMSTSLSHGGKRVSSMHERDEVSIHLLIVLHFVRRG